MCAGQMNPASRLIGESNFSKIDPLMGSIQRFDTNHVAPKVAGYLGQVPRGYEAPGSKPAPVKVVKSPTANRWGAGAAGARGASGSLLTGQSTPAPKTTLLGG